MIYIAELTKIESAEEQIYLTTQTWYSYVRQTISDQLFTQYNSYLPTVIFQSILTVHCVVCLNL